MDLLKTINKHPGAFIGKQGFEQTVVDGMTGLVGRDMAKHVMAGKI